MKTFVEDNKITDQKKYDNVMSILMQRYQAENDENSIFKRIEEYIKTKTDSKEEVEAALNEVKENLKNDESTIEEIKDDNSGETENVGTEERTGEGTVQTAEGDTDATDSTISA